MRSRVPLIFASCLLLYFSSSSLGAGDLLPPIQLLAGQSPIDVKRTGHSAPFVGDFDEDGANDLLVGEFHEGRLRIFRNLGTTEKPRFEDYRWFQAGEELGRVPTG